MSRFFESISQAELAKKIVDTVVKSMEQSNRHDREDFEDALGGKIEDYLPEIVLEKASCYIHWTNLTSTIYKDLSKCEFSNENITSSRDKDDCFIDELREITGLSTLKNNMSFVGVQAGGDWEHPLYFCIYWDGSKLRAYIPSAGNAWNTDIKMAYGNDEDKDQANLKKRLGLEKAGRWIEPTEVIDKEKIVTEIKKHITVRPTEEQLEDGWRVLYDGRGAQAVMDPVGATYTLVLVKNGRIYKRLQPVDGYTGIQDYKKKIKKLLQEQMEALNKPFIKEKKFVRIEEF